MGIYFSLTLFINFLVYVIKGKYNEIVLGSCGREHLENISGFILNTLPAILQDSNQSIYSFIHPLYVYLQYAILHTIL